MYSPLRHVPGRAFGASVDMSPACALEALRGRRKAFPLICAAAPRRAFARRPWHSARAGAGDHHRYRSRRTGRSDGHTAGRQSPATGGAPGDWPSAGAATRPSSSHPCSLGRRWFPHSGAHRALAAHPARGSAAHQRAPRRARPQARGAPVQRFTVWSNPTVARSSRLLPLSVPVAPGASRRVDARRRIHRLHALPSRCGVGGGSTWCGGGVEALSWCWQQSLQLMDGRIARAMRRAQADEIGVSKLRGDLHRGETQAVTNVHGRPARQEQRRSAR